LLGANLNPMMRQYWELKARYRNCMLFFRLGDFYEMFFEDAERASRLLGLTLTSRGSGGDRAPMCGVPCHSAHTYIAKLMAAGEKVAVCEQMEDSRKAGGLLKREVVRVLTPGTVVEGNLLAERRNNWLTAVVGTPVELGVASADLSTGEFTATCFSGPDALQEAKHEIYRLNPAEVLAANDLMEKLGMSGTSCTPTEGVATAAEARSALLRHFAVASLAAFGCEDSVTVQQAAATLIDYLGKTHRGGLEHLKKLTTYSTDSSVRLDTFTLSALEVVESLAGEGKGPTLLSVLDSTQNAMGGRSLRRWLLRPPVSAAVILDRHDAVEWLVERPQERNAIRDLIRQCTDLERVTGRVGARSANARDLSAMRTALGLISRLRAALVASSAPGLLAENASLMADLPELSGLLVTALVDDPPASLSEGGFIRDGWHPEVDELRILARSSREVLAEIQARERARTGIDSLKVQYNSVFGYFIEVTKAKSSQVPSDYTRKQTLTGAERYITPELKEIEGRILGASDRVCALEKELFDELRTRVAGWVPHLLAMSTAVGIVDALAALAETAAKKGYVRPKMDPSGAIEIIDGRHPVLESVQPVFVSNDVRLQPWQEHILVVTGPNMAGKSTFLRQTALITLMAHAGSFVPAKEASIAVVDGIFCRIGASDRLAQGKSTFMVEMTEVAQILNHATEKSLLVFDEVGRGTSTYDGISIAWAIVEHVAREIKAKTLFATHYFELTALSDRFPSVANYNVLVREWKNELVFLYKIAPGRADRSYGVHVARLAGLPENVIGRAGELLKELERGTPREKTAASGGQLSLFEPLPDPVRLKIEQTEVEALTPLEAINLLHSIREMIRGGSGYSNA
jgi:DNA mismatch repair protein MutS